MRLDSVSYVQFRDQPQEWRLEDLALGPINLLVGKNATGKSRSLSIILNLAKLLRGEQKPTQLSGEYVATFSNAGSAIRYEVAYDESGVLAEELTIDGQPRLSRKRGGPGQIYAEKEQKHIDFAPPDTELAAVARRDSVQHPFLEPLHEWGSSVFCYLFGTSLGREFLAVFISGQAMPDVDPRDPNRVVAIFRKGEKDFGEPFREAIAADMTAIGFDAEDVMLAPPTSMRVEISIGEVKGLSVKERDLSSPTDQSSMSQGMFRALSTIVQVNYAILALRPSCILIDDVGEGLDFERSCALIDVLRRKAADTQSLQLVMATNDRFVMNRVPLEEWTVLRRDGVRSRVANYANSRALFEDFKFTGLSNFDFFATDYLNRTQEST